CQASGISSLPAARTWPRAANRASSRSTQPCVRASSRAGRDSIGTLQAPADDETGATPTSDTALQPPSMRAVAFARDGALGRLRARRPGGSVGKRLGTALRQASGLVRAFLGREPRI